MKKAIVIFSGGQDSTTCLVWALTHYAEVECITFVYGQKHSVEIEQSKKICAMLNVRQLIIPIDFLNLIADSALLSNTDQEISELNEKGLPVSFVPNRNQLFITLAHAYAQKVGATALITGVCQTDYSGYPDCRAEFISAITKASNLGSNSDINILTPLMNKTKAQIFQLAAEYEHLEFVLEHSHTCYNGDRERRNEYGYGCNECPACDLRRKGFIEYKNRNGSNI